MTKNHQNKGGRSPEMRMDENQSRRPPPHTHTDKLHVSQQDLT